MAVTGLKRIFLKVPFVRLFYDIPNNALGDAINETIWTTFFASFPLWFMPAIGLILLRHGTPIGNEIQSGEAFVYSEAIVGPLIYVLFKQKFPYGNFFLGLSIVLLIANVASFTLLKCLDLLSSSAASSLNVVGLVYASWIVLIITTVMSVLISVSKSGLENIARVQPTEEQAFAADWKDQKHD